MDAATGSTSVLWQVRRSHRDFYTAAVGTANIPFTPTPRSHSGPMQPRTKAIFDHAVLRAAPLIADLQDGPIGIWGSRDECLCIARSLVCQLTTLSGPADFRLAVATDEARAEDWRFTAWLPHTQTGSTNPHERFIALDTTQASSMLRGLRDLLNTPEPASMLIVAVLVGQVHLLTLTVLVRCTIRPDVTRRKTFPRGDCVSLTRPDPRTSGDRQRAPSAP